jgi:hypothetical protein
VHSDEAERYEPEIEVQRSPMLLAVKLASKDRKNRLSRHLLLYIYVKN